MQSFLNTLRLLFLTILLLGSLGSTTSVFAESAIGGGGGGTPSLIPEDPTSTIDPSCDFQTGSVHAECVPKYLNYLIGLIFSLSGAFFILMVIYSGYQIALGSVTGNKEEGKQRLTWAIIGLIMSALSFFLIDFIIQAVSS